LSRATTDPAPGGGDDKAHLMLAADSLPALLAAVQATRQAITDPSAVRTPAEEADPAAYPPQVIVKGRVDSLRGLLYKTARQDYRRENENPTDPALPPRVRKQIGELRDKLMWWYFAGGYQPQGGAEQDELLICLGELAEVLAGQPTFTGLELIPGGFAYHGRPYHLAGKPRDMLGALLASRYRRATALDLFEPLGVDVRSVSFPEQAVKDQARILRKALRMARNEAGLPPADPLPSKGRGEQLSYGLNMP
jgi:hypothetical protein